MLGQTKNKEILMQWRLKRDIPRFIIIEGDEGSGRLELAKVIIKMMNAVGVIGGNGIADVREIIENAYNIASTTCYIFRDADDMSVAAKNSLLKVVEEPPNKAYFIMTIKSSSNMLDTILSRAVLLRMQPYTPQELQKLNINNLPLEYINNPGKLKTLENSQISTCSRLVCDVIDSLINKSGTSLLKACSLLQAKDTEVDKVNCELFLKVFEYDIFKAVKSNQIDLRRVSFVVYLETCKNEFKRTSINKKSSIECMLLKILEDFKNGAEVS